MAGMIRTYWRNYDSSDNTAYITETNFTSSILFTIEECGFSAPTGKAFKEWNSARDGTGTSYQAGTIATTSESVYAIWESADISISYAGSQIATMNSSGTKTLLTSGKYCTDNIIIDYTKTGITVTETLDSHGGTIVSISGDPVTSLQAKTVTPTSQSQTISADSGYDAISEVLVQGDSNLISSNIASGVSIFGVVGTFAGGENLKSFIEQHGTMTSFSNSEVSTIGTGAFAYCSSLTTVNFPSCTSIGLSAFAYCSNLTTVSFPSCTRIGANAFYSCSSLTTVSFPSCTSIGGYAFYYCSKLTTVSFPSCTSISNYAFAYCTSLTTVSFPSCTSIGSYAYTNCSRLTTVSFSSCTSIGANAFMYCSSLTATSFPLCTSIGNSAFAYCYSLTTVSFPSCTSIGANAFNRCYNLLSLYLTGSSVANLSNSNAFTSAPIAGYTTSTGGVYGSIFVPSSLYSTYIASTNWVYFSSRFVSV